MADSDTPCLLSKERAIAWVILLGLCLLSPWFLAWRPNHSRAGVYRGVPVDPGRFPVPFSAIDRQIFQEQSDIDVLFLGDSLIWMGIDVPEVRNAMARDLGHPVNVISFMGNGWNLDRNYVLLRDLLAHRHVRIVVFSMPTPTPGLGNEDKPHVQSSNWMRLGDDPNLFHGCSLSDRASLYATMVLGVPRQLLTAIRPNLADPHETDPALLDGVGSRYGFMGLPFQEVPIQNWPPSAKSIRFAPETSGNFRVTGPALGRLPRHFVTLFAGLLKRYGVKGIILTVPTYSERNSKFVEEMEYWPDLLGPDVAMVGVQPNLLFRGLSEDQIQRYFYNEHLNLNGKRIFTRAVIPVLKDIYVETVPKS